MRLGFICKAVILTWLVVHVDGPVLPVGGGKSVPMDSYIPSIDLENWMGSLPKDVKEQPLALLSIPGSHNSATCDLSSKVGNDASFPNIPIFARAWATCQNLSITQQLKHGIRYLDFRLDWDQKKDNFFITHFLRSRSSPLECLKCVNSFLKTHPKEVVIIDFQHYYRFNQLQHESFLSSVWDLFGSLICPILNKPTDLTMTHMEENGYQVVLIDRYDCKNCSWKFKRFCFGSHDFPTFWPNTDKASKVIDAAKTAHRNRHNFGYITQLVLTVQKASNFVFLDLKNFCKSQLHGKSMRWLYNIQGGTQPNIIIADFVEFQNFSFPLAVVKLNYLKAGESLAQMEHSLKRKKYINHLWHEHIKREWINSRGRVTQFHNISPKNLKEENEKFHYKKKSSIC